MSFEVGARVETEKCGKGRVAFVGPTAFSEGEWIGVILDEPKGKNNGSVQGTSYFECEPNYGLFIKPTQLKLEAGAARAPRRSMAPGLKAPTTGLRSGPTSKSPITSPKMSPAVSKENISKSTTAARKPSSSSKLSEMAAEPKMMSRENSNLSVKNEPPPEPKTQTVGELVKKVEEKHSVPSTPIHMPPMSFEDSTQIERLKVDNKDLTEKLETLRIKRREDQQRIKELELESQKVQSLMQLRTKMADDNKDLMRQLEESKMELDGLREWKAIHQEQNNMAGTDLEMALIDKEMAEEKADMLQRENDALNEQLEELKTNLEILREEMAAAGSGGAAPVGNSVQMKQLEAHNEKLKQAVIKLRDLFDAANVAKLEAEKQMNEKDDEILELLEAGEIYRKQAMEAEKRIQDYQEQADAALGAEEMVTILSSKNLEMEDRIAQLEMDKEELEAIHDMDEQLAETQRDIEKDLRKDMDLLNGKIRELIQKLLAEEKHNDDLMETIRKFRDNTVALNEQIQDRNDQILRYQEALSGQKSDEKSAASLVHQQQYNANKIFLESVERHLNAIELEYARRHNSYLKAFLPDNFTKPGGDSDAVQLNILFPRIVAKSALFPKLVSEKFPTVPGGIRREHVTKSHKAEQWGQTAKVSYLCSSLSTVCSQFESAIQKMSVESLVRLSQLQPEISAHEKSLDSYIELLKQGRFDENTALDSLRKGINYFVNNLAINVGYDGFSFKAYAEALSRQMTLAMSWMKLSIQRISYSLAPESESSDVATFLQKLTGEIEHCELLISRLNKVIPEKDFKIQQQTVEEAQATILMCERMADLLNNVSNVASVQLSMDTEHDGLAASRLKEIIHAAVEKAFGSTLLEKAYEPVDKYLLGLKSGLSDFLSIFESGNFVEEPADKQIFPPMLERAHLRKQAAAEAEGLRWQLEKKDMEIQELKKGMKSRQDEIGNYRHRLELTESRMNSSGQQETAKTKILEDKLDQLNLDINKQKLDYEQIQERLSADIRDLQKENDELRKAKNNMSKVALYQSVAATATASNTKAGSGSVNTTENPATRAELNLLELTLEESQRNLRSANLEISRLRSENSIITGLSVPELPDLICGPETLRAKKSKTLLDDMWEEAQQLRREELKYSVFFADTTKSTEENTEAKEKFLQERQRIATRANSMRVHLRRLWNQAHPDVELPSLFKNPPVAPKKIDQAGFDAILAKWGRASA